MYLSPRSHPFIRLQLIKVYNGELILADFQSLLDVTSFIGFTSNGQPLIQVSKESVMPSAGPLRWNFNKLRSPWQFKITQALDW